jgi:8-oxo-dGTP pyrophosphatase MutT (NUDIX family)
MLAEHATLKRILHDRPPMPARVPDGYERDAVTLLLVDRAETRALLIQKADNQGYRWRAHVALPGGRIDANDDDASAAALRELHEELGVSQDAVEVFGTMGHFQTWHSKNDLEVIVGRWTDPTSVCVDPREVSQFFEVPLSQLMALHVERGFRGEAADAIGEALVYPVEGVNIWGVTARILHAFLELAAGHHVLPAYPASPRHPFRCC